MNIYELKTANIGDGTMFRGLLRLGCIRDRHYVNIVTEQ
jgi:hypothetical protein